MPAWPEFRRTAALLADGRALTYYDRPGAPERTRVDQRPLAPVAATSELRRDELTGEWVIVAGHRQDRTFLPTQATGCPLCPSTPGNPTEVPEDDYEVAVFDNRFPSLTPDAGGDLSSDRRPGFGRCEVVCFTSQHDLRLADLDSDRVLLVVQALIDVVRRVRSDPRIESCLVFENRGAEIGVTISHPHGQIYAYPFVPPREQLLVDAARRHHAATGRALALDLAEAEARRGERLVAMTDQWIAHVPEAARWPFEIRLTPRREVAALDALTPAEALDFADLYPRILRALDDAYGVPMPYIAAWHQSSLRDDAPGTQLFLEVFSTRRAPDRLKYLAGSESAAGVWINDIRPEDSAAIVRGALAT
ncbi:MAG: galactose-1-phosphate uridylyltransferase [Actinomycetota bacterium]